MSVNAKTKAIQKSWLHMGTLRISRLHFLYVLVLAVQIIVYDSWKLIPMEVVMQRWIMTAILLVITCIVWFLARSHISSTNAYKALVGILILTDVAVASFNVYTQRGMASRAVFLYVIPIAVASILLSRSALLATAGICVAAYIATTYTYFVLHFNEGYKIELYGEVGFYSAMFIILSLMLWVTVRAKKSPHKS